MDLQLEIVVRMLVGALLGGVIGYERDVHGRPAGLRTHLIVGLASSTFMVVSTHFVYFQHYGKQDLVSVDPSRIAASVVTGIGFLGGGAILRTGIGVQGLTTAAGLWLVAAIGLSAGAGMYVVSLCATALGIVGLSLLRRFENKQDNMIPCRISLVFGGDAPPMSALARSVEALGGTVSPAGYERQVDERRVEVTLQARVPMDQSQRLVEALESQPNLQRVRIGPAG